jgi:GNAT superfamily N-acetyltransferase
MTFTIRLLERTDNRKEFRSGNIELDRFFIHFAGQNQFKHHIGVTYIALTASQMIAGFATVSASVIAAHRAPKKLRHVKYQLPVLRVARLAVDERMKSMGVGRLLIASAFRLALEMSKSVGCVGVVVDAKSEAISFYEKLEFDKLDVVSGALGDRPEAALMFREI